MKLYVWYEYMPGCQGDGVAFAVAESEEQARREIEKYLGHPFQGYQGECIKHSLSEPIGYAVPGCD